MSVYHLFLSKAILKTLGGTAIRNLSGNHSYVMGKKRKAAIAICL